MSTTHSHQSLEGGRRRFGWGRKKSRSFDGGSLSGDSRQSDDFGGKPHRRRFFSRDDAHGETAQKKKNFRNITRKMNVLGAKRRVFSDDEGGAFSDDDSGTRDIPPFSSISIQQTDSLGGSEHSGSNASSTPKKKGIFKRGRRARFSEDSSAGGPSVGGEDGMLEVFNSRQNRVSFDEPSPRTTVPKQNSMRNLSAEPLRARSNSSDDVVMPLGAGREHNRPNFERARYSVYQGNSSVKKKMRVRPHHCFPHGWQATEEEIYADSTLLSKQFVFLESYLSSTNKSLMQKTEVNESTKLMFGSPQKDGRIGSLRVEVIGCISINRTKPDVAAFLVCGDSAFSTDVISGYRAPMWPCASRRAAVFPLHHSYAKLYVGVFDVKSRKNKEKDVFCGRTVIDVATLRPGTEYDTTMPLRASSFVYDRRKRGVIRLRFSIHWFHEKATLLSGLKPPQSKVLSSPLSHGHPVIPCADPKTFRNVAVTVYGQDLPGKYTKNSFRATVREFNLYQVNIRYLAKHLALDIVMYERPLTSFYLFCATMHCVWASSMRMVPAYFVGFLIILHYQLYRHFLESDKFNLGYQPLTILEMFNTLLNNTTLSSFKATQVHKRAKQRGVERTGRLGGGSEGTDGGESTEVVNVDHREFPFSERDQYPRFGVEDALAPGAKSSGGGHTRLHGRLSVYYSSTDNMDDSGDVGGNDDDLSDGSEGDDETVMTEGHMGDDIFDLDDDDDDELGPMVIGETEEEFESMLGLSAGTLSESNSGLAAVIRQGIKSSNRRIKPGPQQNSDTSSGSKVPPQVQLKRVENIMHKFSKQVAYEPVAVATPAADGAAGRRASLAVSTEAIQQNEKFKRKATQDEFDKLLGLQTRSSNPIVKISAIFLGPIQRMMRICNYVFRILFNVSTWRDPFLSFWVFCGLVVLFVILVVFPWRSFFMLASLACLGPQNLLYRWHMEKKAAKKAREEEEKRLAAIDDDPYGYGDMNMTPKLTPDSGRHLGNTTRRNRNKKKASHIELAERPPFSSQIWSQSGSSNKKPLEPRSVVIPYGRFKKDRFYDWPPDPYVSKATPLAWFEEQDDAHANHAPAEEEIPQPKYNSDFKLDMVGSNRQNELRRRRLD